MIAGTIGNYIQLQKLTNKWEQRKNSGNILSRNELNERANWTQEQRMLDDFKNQISEEKESSKKREIADKISCGHRLTPEEEQYLASYDPKALADYRQTQSERKAYEEKLKKCKTKNEVQQLKSTTLGNELASLKKVASDPYISTSEKLKKAQQSLGKARNVEQAEAEFVASGMYDKLPTEEELNAEKIEESIDSAEEVQEVVGEEVAEENVEETVTAKSVGREDPVAEIENITSHFILCQQMDDKLLDQSINMILDEKNDKAVGSKFNFSA